MEMYGRRQADDPARHPGPPSEADNERPALDFGEYFEIIDKTPASSRPVPYYIGGEETGVIPTLLRLVLTKYRRRDAKD